MRTDELAEPIRGVLQAKGFAQEIAQNEREQSDSNLPRDLTKASVQRSDRRCQSDESGEGSEQRLQMSLVSHCGRPLGSQSRDAAGHNRQNVRYGPDHPRNEPMAFPKGKTTSFILAKRRGGMQLTALVRGVA